MAVQVISNYSVFKTGSTALKVIAARYDPLWEYECITTQFYLEMGMPVKPILGIECQRGCWSVAIDILISCSICTLRLN